MTYKIALVASMLMMLNGYYKNPVSLPDIGADFYKTGVCGSPTKGVMASIFQNTEIH